jgi:hypothetical protein
MCRHVSSTVNNEPHRTVDADRDGRFNCSASGVADHRQLLTKKPAGVNRRGYSPPLALEMNFST